MSASPEHNAGLYEVTGDDSNFDCSTDGQLELESLHAEASNSRPAIDQVQAWFDDETQQVALERALALMPAKGAELLRMRCSAEGRHLTVSEFAEQTGQQRQVVGDALSCASIEVLPMLRQIADGTFDYAAWQSTRGRPRHMLGFLGKAGIDMPKDARLEVLATIARDALDAVDGVSERSKRIVADYYGLSGQEPVSSSALAAKMGGTARNITLTAERVLQRVAWQSLVTPATEKATARPLDISVEQYLTDPVYNVTAERALTLLGPKSARVVALRLGLNGVAQMTAPEVGVSMGLRTDTVRQHMLLARETLADILPRIADGTFNYAAWESIAGRQRTVMGLMARAGIPIPPDVATKDLAQEMAEIVRTTPHIAETDKRLLVSLYGLPLDSSIQQSVESDNSVLNRGVVSRLNRSMRKVGEAYDPETTFWPVEQRRLALMISQRLLPATVLNDCIIADNDNAVTAVLSGKSLIFGAGSQHVDVSGDSLLGFNIAAAHSGIDTGNRFVRVADVCQLAGHNRYDAMTQAIASLACDIRDASGNDAILWRGEDSEASFAVQGMRFNEPVASIESVFPSDIARQIRHTMAKLTIERECVTDILLADSSPEAATPVVVSERHTQTAPGIASSLETYEAILQNPDKVLSKAANDPGMTVALERMLVLIPPANARVLRLKFGLLGEDALKTIDIARQLGLDPATVSGQITVAKGLAARMVLDIRAGQFDYAAWERRNRKVRGLLGFMAKAGLSIAEDATLSELASTLRQKLEETEGISASDLEVVIARYGLRSGNPMTLRELQKRLGVSYGVATGIINGVVRTLRTGSAGVKKPSKGEGGPSSSSKNTKSKGTVRAKTTTPPSFTSFATIPASTIHGDAIKLQESAEQRPTPHTDRAHEILQAVPYRDLVVWNEIPEPAALPANEERRWEYAVEDLTRLVDETHRQNVQERPWLIGGLALCTQLSTEQQEVFYPVSEQDPAIEMAKKICAACPLLTNCVLYVVKNPDPHAIIGMMTPEEVRRVRAEWGTSNSKPKPDEQKPGRRRRWVQ